LLRMARYLHHEQREHHEIILHIPNEWIPVDFYLFFKENFQ
jgi:hypothetical protein